MPEDTPFDKSIKDGNYDAFRTLYLGNFSQEELDHALGEATSNGRIRMVRDLLAKGANIDSQTDEDKNTPLRIAAIMALPRTLQFLLMSGANKDIKNRRGLTALNWVERDIDNFEGRVDSNSNVNTEILEGLHHMEELLREPEMVTIMTDERGLLEEHSDNNSGNSNGNSNNNNSNNTNNSNNNSGSRVVDIPTTIPMNIAGMNMPTNAPSKCFDPVMYNDDTDITDNMTTFYVMSSGSKVIHVGCLDNEGLGHYKDDTSYLFFKCKQHVPLTAMNVRPTDVEVNNALRKLSFKMSIYVNDSQMQSVKPGKKYILVPTNNEVGAIASYDVVKAGGALVSSDHCGFKYADRIHDIYEVNTAGAGGRRRPRSRRTIASKRKANRGTRRMR